MSYDYRFRLLMSLALVGSTAALAGCGDTGADCGVGTTEVDGECIPNDMVCGPGTVFDMMTSTCVPESTTTCGAGTILVDGMCVPESNVMCARGTVLTDGECVPDGSVICGPNTIFNTETGTCEPDPESICEGDLVFVEESGTCVDPDELLEGMADVLELGEINDPAFNEGAMPQVVDIADGSGSFYGCVEPMDFDEDGAVDADLDFFQISVDGPTLLNVRADGIRGLSAAVAFFGTDDDLLDAGWQRVIGSLSGVSSNGQVFLPEAGDYFVAASDSRSLLLADVVAGGPNQCYFVQLTEEELPSPTTLVTDEPMTGTFGNPQFFTVTDVATGDLIFGEMNELNDMDEAEDNPNVSSAIVAVVNGEFFGQSGSGGAVVANSLEAGDEVLFVVDTVVNVSFDDVNFDIEATKPVVQEMPTDGSALTLTHDDEQFVWAFFTATEGDVVRIQADQVDGDGVNWDFFNPNGVGFGVQFDPFFGPTALASIDEYIQITSTGIHYVRLFNTNGTQDVDYDVNFTQTNITPSELTLGTAATGDLATESRGFFSLDLSTNDWIEFAVSALTNVTDVNVRWYDRSAFGNLDDSLFPIDTGVTDTAFERILLGEGANVLITVEDDDGHDGDESIDLAVSDVPYTDLGAVDSATAAMRTDETLAADGIGRYVVQGTVSGEIVNILASSATLDLVLTTLEIPDAIDDVVVDAGGATEDESYDEGVGPDGLTIAFTVTDFDGDPGMYDLNVTAAPPPYSSAAAALTFASICPSQGGTGTVVDFPATPTTENDDEMSAELTLADGGAFPFEFFGNAQTTFFVSTNGYLTFRAGAGPGEGFSLTNLNSGDTDVIAPYADDLMEIESCWERDVDVFTVEWRGETWASGGPGSGNPIEFQAILHTSGRIDFVYGPGHTATLSASDFAGLWNDDASVQLALDGMPAADASFTWTPAP